MNHSKGQSAVGGAMPIALLIVSLAFAVSAYGQAPPPGKAVASSAALSSDSSDKADPPIQPTKASDKTPDITLDPASLIPDLPPIGAANATLIGGMIERIDPVQDEITIRVFGGGKMKALFDPRTNVSSDGKPASIEQLKAGQRIYADTILLDGTVFARNIRLTGLSSLGQCQGVVVAYRSDKNILELRDQLSPAPMSLRITSRTHIARGNQVASANDLVPGTLVSVNFLPEPGPGSHPAAQQVDILITPGTQFSFTGLVTALDLHLGLLVVTSTADHRMYEVHFDPATLPVSPDLREGAEVTVLAQYDGSDYVARALTVKKSAAAN